MKNKIPGILKERDIKVGQLHEMSIIGGKETRLSRPTCSELANAEYLTSGINLGTIEKVAKTLGVYDISELVQFEITE